MPSLLLSHTPHFTSPYLTTKFASGFRARKFTPVHTNPALEI